VLETVDFEKFKQFLRDVGFAQEHFAPLEQGLPETDELLQARAAFYRSCTEWRAFLDLTDQLVVSPLGVDVDGEDPLSQASGRVKVDDTAQHYYDFVELDLGLEVEEEGTWNRAPLMIATDVEVRAQTKMPSTRWDWKPEAGDRVLMIKLIDGQQPDWAKQRFASLDDPLGDASAMAFCAYLHHYGKKLGTREWITTHSFDLPKGLLAKGQGALSRAVDKTGKTQVGLSFRFKLARPMPEPIEKLEPAD
jgi:hypothetical protein